MSEKRAIDLYELLPALYRLEDIERGYPLRGLLDIITEQVDITKQNIDGLWDDYFVETCADWVIPYIGDLVGNNPLHEVAQRRRVDVAKTIYYRRRKGTLAMLEELARDVTGWGAHAVAFFELLGWTQNLNHLRSQLAPNPWNRDPSAVDRVGTVYLRNLDGLDRLGGPFDVITHSVDVRPLCHLKGWYNIRNIGFFLWRLRSYPLAEIEARRSRCVSCEYGYHFSTLGNPAPLFNSDRRETDDTGLATEIHVPGPIRPLAFAADVERYRLAQVANTAAEPPSQYYGTWEGVGTEERLSLSIRKDGVDIPPQSVVCMDLGTWQRPPEEITYKDKDGADRDVAIEAGVDVRRGRVSFASGKEPAEKVEVSYHYGFGADMGAGPYDRRATLSTPEEATWYLVVAKERPDLEELPASVVWRETLQAALSEWHNDKPGRAIIEIWDNGVYSGVTAVNLSPQQHLVIQARNRTRPTLRFEDGTGDLAELEVGGGTGRVAALRLNGLLMEGGIRVRAESVEELEIVHCTLVPGWELNEAGKPMWPERASIVIEDDNDSLEVTMDHSIVGALWLPDGMQHLTVTDSIIDGGPDEIAIPLQVLLSGDLASFPTLSSDPPRVQITIGEEGPFIARLERVPASLAAARDELVGAIRRAHSSEAFTEASVGIVGRRLVVLPGVRDVAVTFAEAPDDDTATALRLTEAHAQPSEALLSAHLPPDLGLETHQRSVDVTIGTDGPYTVTLTGSLNSLARIRDELQRAMRGAASVPAFAGVWVITVNDSMGLDRLLILPREPRGQITVEQDAKDTLLLQLRFARQEHVRWYAIAAIQNRGPGPPVTLERTTVFGEVLVRELTLASEVVFCSQVNAQRRQSGCVRFSHVPYESKVPPRYCCQPDLALGARAKELGMPEATLPASEKEAVRSRMAPCFTSTHYGDPGFSQLGLTCAEEIRTGAEDGAEMGAFNHLKQPQRETNLHIRLEEYLPFGLKAGLIYVT